MAKANLNSVARAVRMATLGGKGFDAADNEEDEGEEGVGLGEGLRFL